MDKQSTHQKNPAAPTRSHPTKNSVKSPVHQEDDLQGAIGNREMGLLMETHPHIQPSSQNATMVGEKPMQGGMMPVSSGRIQRQPLFGGLSQELVATEEVESGRLRESRFRHDFSQVGIERGGVPPIQAKLTIGAPNDKYEQEADRVASQVVQQINAPASLQSSQGQSVQRTEAPEEEEIQAKPEKSSLQRRVAIAGGEASTDLSSAINSARGGGQPIDAGLQRSMGQAMVANFSGVRVHTDGRADQLNQSVQAKAFTTGPDVFFRQGAYEPGSRGGKELLAHELTHVVQQNGGAERSPLQPQKLPQPPATEPPLATEGDRVIQAKGEMIGNSQITSEVSRPNKTGLPDRLKTGIEHLSGYSMDDVRVHYNSNKPAQLQAVAYAQGTDIYVASGQEQHLFHEAWHVVQQKQGRVKPTLQMKGVEINDDQGLEKEADVMGAKAFQVIETELVQSSDDVLSNQGTRQAIPTAQRLAVIQLSTDETEAAQMAATDIEISLAKHEKSRLKIEAIRAGQEPTEEEVEDPFAELLPQTTGHTVATRRTVPFAVNRGNGWEEYRLPVQDLNNTIEICRARGWYLQVHSLPRGHELGEQGKIIQRAAIAAGYGGGTMDEYAMATLINVPAPNLANGTLTFAGVTLSNTSTGATGTSLNRQPNGAPVGGTRPAQWTDFIDMIGNINPFKQGHMISERLGGDGNHDNLTPFTPSLNGLHYTRVESHVINQTDDAAPSRDEYADYSVIPTYGGNPGIVGWALIQFGAMTPNNQRSAMVTAGIITGAAAAAYLPGTPLSVADLALANTWLTNYINGAFSTNIVCQAKFIDAVAGGTFDSTPPQTVTITNDF